MNKPKVTLEQILKRPIAFTDWLFQGKLSRNENNLLKRLDELDTSLTISDLEENQLLERIAHNASQKHYERCLFSK